MRRWRQGFAYRIDVPVWSFLAAGSLTLIVAMATIAWQAVKAAQTDPFETTGHELYRELREIIRLKPKGLFPVFYIIEY